MNISLAEKMMGHSVTIALDNVYLDPTIEQLFQEFKKAIPELTIDNSTRKQAELDQMKQNQSEYEKEKMKYNNLTKDFEEFKEEMKSFIKEMREKEDS